MIKLKNYQKCDILSKDALSLGYWMKKDGTGAFPYIDNLLFLGEEDIFWGDKMVDRLQRLKSDIQQKQAYEFFLKNKAKRPVVDIYACFQPFNEATKSLYPFFKRVKSQVKPGDVILNLWDRSGWMTTLLAGLFPQQQIVSTWEGNKDILGYKGFYYWFSNVDNVTVIFCELDTPLPFAEQSISFVVGHDMFHRCNQSLFIRDLLPLVKDNGVMVFPHVHLTNSEPEPFFERGCKQIHGKDYDVFFKELSKHNGWNGYVFSEPELFKANDISFSNSIPLITNPNTSDYNALLALLPKTWGSGTLQAFSLHDIKKIDEAFVLLNPLLTIIAHQRIVITTQKMDGAVGQLLERHPIYLKRLDALDGYTLSEYEAKILFLANQGCRIKSIRDHLGVALSNLISKLAKLEKLGVLQVLPISDSGFRLQNFISTQKYLVPEGQETLKHLWESATIDNSEELLLLSLKDESEFTYEECDEIVQSIVVRILAAGLQKGDKILICSSLHIESILLFWACMQLGIVVVPVGPNLTWNSLKYIIDLVHPKRFFLSLPIYEKYQNDFNSDEIVVFDEHQEMDGLDFSSWLEEVEELEPASIEIYTHDPAVILFTSGSTGVPKGVEISHGSLFRSGQSISETFNWKETDRFLAIGGIDTMSGLRNTCIATLHSGAALVAYDQYTPNVLGIAERIEQCQVTLIATNPVLLRQFVKFHDRIKDQLNSLVTIMCTGSNLSGKLRSDFMAAFGKPIFNYYGLTETTGICIAQSPLDQAPSSIGIGKSVDAIVQIVNDSNQVLPVGEKGEIRIFSRNLMKGYFCNPALTKAVLKDGWFYTEDIGQYTKDGSIELLGRKRDIIKSASEEIIYLGALENFIAHLEDIEKVAICPYTEEDQEKIAAFIISANTSTDLEQLKKQIMEKVRNELGETKVPNIISFKMEFPYSENGKLQKAKLLNELF